MPPMVRNLRYKKVLKVKTSEADKVHAEQVKTLKESIKEALKDCKDVDKLQAALDCLDNDSEINFIVEGE